MVDLNAINEAIAKHGVRLESDATRSTLPLTVRLVPLKRDFGMEIIDKFYVENPSYKEKRFNCFTPPLFGGWGNCTDDLMRSIANAAIREFAKALTDKLSAERVFWTAGSEQETVFRMYLDMLLPEGDK